MTKVPLSSQDFSLQEGPWNHISVGQIACHWARNVIQVSRIRRRISQTRRRSSLIYLPKTSLLYLTTQTSLTYLEKAKPNIGLNHQIRRIRRRISLTYQPKINPNASLKCRTHHTNGQPSQLGTQAQSRRDHKEDQESPTKKAGLTQRRKESQP